MTLVMFSFIWNSEKGINEKKKKKRETEIRLKLPEAVGWRMGLIANGDERTLSDN